MPPVSLREKLDVTKTLETFRQTRGRPSFTVRHDPNVSGTFSHYEHMSTTPLAPPPRRSRSVASDGSVVRRAPDVNEPWKPLHEKPFRSPSSNPPAFDRTESTTKSELSAAERYRRSRSQSSAVGLSSRAGSRSASAANVSRSHSTRNPYVLQTSRSEKSATAETPRGRSPSVQAQTQDGYTRSVSNNNRSASSNNRQHSTVPPPPRIDEAINLNAFTRGISRKTDYNRRAETERQAIRKTLDVRFGLVTETQSAKTGKAMHPVPHDGLRVSYYDKGRKMTTAELRHTKREDVNEKTSAASPNRHEEKKYGKGLNENAWKSVTSFLDGDACKKLVLVNQAVSACALTALEDADTSAEQKNWKALRTADGKVRDIPASFYDALRQLKTQPPRPVLTVLFLAALLLDEALSDELSAEDMWACVQVFLSKEVSSEELGVRLAKNPMGSVNSARVETIRRMIAAEDESARQAGGDIATLQSVVEGQSEHAGSILAYIVAFLTVFEQEVK